MSGTDCGSYLANKQVTIYYIVIILWICPPCTFKIPNVSTIQNSYCLAHHFMWIQYLGVVNKPEFVNYGLAQCLKEEEFENWSNGLIKFVGIYIWENMSKLHHFIARMYWCKSWSTFLDFKNMFLQFICNNIEVVSLCFLSEYLLDSPM